MNQPHSGASLPSQTVRIWDLPTRLFHWVLALCVVVAIVSAKVGGNAMTLHFYMGYSVLTLLLFRLIWGVVGGRWSRFVSFVPSPVRTWRYLRDTLAGTAPASPGHNPLGAWSVLALLGLLGLQVGTGLFSQDEQGHYGPLNILVNTDLAEGLTELHKEMGESVLILLIGLHLAAIAFYKWVKRQDLIRPMIDGNKRLTEPVPPSRDSWATRAAAALIFVALVALVRWIVAFGEAQTPSF